MEKVLNLLKEQGKMNFAPTASPSDIETFEKKNGISLPVRFKEWLLASDGGELFLPGGVQLYGVAHKPLIDVNDADRPNDRFVVIGSLASGDPILFEKNKEAISIYNREAGRIESDEVFVDFAAFIKQLRNTLGIDG
jgi:hypothetical protein